MIVSHLLTIMLVHLLQIFTLVIAITVIGIYCNVCEFGWFGESCTFMCHCATYVNCELDGTCIIGDSCKTGFFGPGCQYVDLLAWVAIHYASSFLTDNNESTCNPDPAATSVDLTLKKAYPFTWFRILVNDNENLLNFVTKLNNGKPCIAERKFVFDNNTVDVTCDHKTKFTRLRIEGRISPAICRIYISGGRNVALKQTTRQSSQYNTSDLKACASGNAVDGNTSSDYEQRHCSQTAKEEQPEFYIHYTQLYTLYTVRIYNSNSQQYRLREFTLETFSANGSVTNFHDDRSRSGLLIYHVYLSSRKPVREIKIVQSKTVPANDRFLTLCEVETYGDPVCPDSFYGLSCQSKCSCIVTEVCNVFTGICADGCDAGFYGYKCTNSCSLDCLHKMCEFRSGRCLQCVPGRTGDFCDKVCEPGTFGTNCKLKCSVGCDGYCDPTNGYCHCNATFKGVLCKDCSDTFYGENCSQPCSQYCLHSVCNQDTGECISCIGRRVGTFCEDCPERFYGTLCDLVCARECINKSCDIRTGRCYACHPGYYGHTCKEERVSVWLIFLLACPIAVLISLCHRRGHIDVPEEPRYSYPGLHILSGLQEEP